MELRILRIVVSMALSAIEDRQQRESKSMFHNVDLASPERNAKSYDLLYDQRAEYLSLIRADAQVIQPRSNNANQAIGILSNHQG